MGQVGGWGDGGSGRGPGNGLSCHKKVGDRGDERNYMRLRLHTCVKADRWQEGEIDHMRKMRSTHCTPAQHHSLHQDICTYPAYSSSLGARLPRDVTRDLAAQLCTITGHHHHMHT